MSNSINNPGFNPVQITDLTQLDQSQPTTAVTESAGLPEVTGLTAARAEGQHEVVTPEASELRGQVEEGLGSKIGRWMSEGFMRLKGDGGLPPQININHPSLGQVTYTNQELKSFINTLPRLERAAARENLVSHLTERIARGAELMNDVISGAKDGENPSLQDISDLMLLLDAKSRASGNGFDRGAFSLEDSQGKLYQYLDRCPEKYLRSSSHIKNEQKAMVDGHLNVQRGIDIPLGSNGLPSGKRTITFGAISPKGDVSRHLFIKPETQGCRLGPLSSQLTQAGSSEYPQRPTRFFSDLGQTIAHGFSFLQAQGVQAEASARREKLSPELVQAFESAKAIIDEFSSNSAPIMRAKGEILAKLDQNDPTGSGQGLHTMIANFKEAMYVVDNNSTRFEGLIDKINQAILAFANDVAPHINDASALDVRMNNEVIFTQDQLQNPTEAQESPSIAVKSGQIVEACALTEADATTFMFRNAIELIPNTLAKNGATAEQLSTARTILSHNPDGGEMKVPQMIANLKNLPAAMPEGTLRNLASSNITSALTVLMPRHQIEGVENNKEKLRVELKSMLPMESFTEAQRQMIDSTPKPSLLLAMHNANQNISTTINNLLDLPEGARANQVNNALQAFYNAVGNSAGGVTDSGDATGEIINNTLQFALKGMSRERQEALYEKLSTPQAQLDRANLSAQVIALRGGAGNVSYGSLMGMHGERPFTNTQIIDTLENMLAIAQDDRLESSFDAVIDARIQGICGQEVQSSLDSVANIADLNVVTVDGKRAVPFDEALAKGKDLMPEQYRTDSNRNMHLSLVSGPRQRPQVLDTVPKLMEAFSMQGSDGQKYLNLDLFRAVTSLACQTSFAPLNEVIQSGIVQGSGVGVMGNVGTPSLKREMVFDAQSMELKMLNKEAQVSMVHVTGRPTPLTNSNTEVELKVGFQSQEGESYTPTLLSSYVGINWRIADEARITT